MTAKTRLHRATRLASAFALLAAICACGGSDDDDAPPPPPVAPPPAVAPPAPPAPVAPAMPPPPPVMPSAPIGVVAQFDLAPGFQPDPRRSTGTAGGSVSASGINPACRGYIGTAPNHTLNLTAPFTNLRLVVSGPADTTLVVQLADGRYLCDDDGGQGANPLVTGPFTAGLHRVFVGTFGPTNTGPGPAYTIGVTELPQVSAATLGGGGTAMPPTGGPTAMAPPPGVVPAGPGGTIVSLRPGFMPDPHTAGGTAGGPLDASALDQSCVGSVPNAPQHTMMLAADFRELRVMVNSSADTTLVIRGPDGRYRCNDDGGGDFRPMVAGSWGPGAYQVWVGVYAGGPAAPYTIGFSELRSVTAGSLPMP